MIRDALLGAGAWTGIALVFGTWWAITGYRAKTRRKKPR